MEQNTSHSVGLLALPYSVLTGFCIILHLFPRMRVALILLVAVTAVSCLQELDVEWNYWKEANEKEYADGEELLRRVIWEDNLVKIQTHNSMKSSYTLKMNKFGDMVCVSISVARGSASRSWQTT